MNKIEDKYFVALSDHLKDFIDKNNIEIADLAAAANLDRRQIYRLINKENIPKLSTLIRISLAAGMEPQQLFNFAFDFKIYMANNNILKVAHKK
ncbi:MAG: helix-turn-helix domain-containing protein [Flavobacteriia bacterium]|nr:helix-turn-helix domain-containing protein [Flavobacteriia bacterium]MBH2023795.1 helix-turn-helix domain-containing protein [Flavobacteriales bacterium]